MKVKRKNKNFSKIPQLKTEAARKYLTEARNGLKDELSKKRSELNNKYPLGNPCRKYFQKIYLDGTKANAETYEKAARILDRR